MWELVATAIANAEAQTELAASRARIVAAADEERRRVVRDLHDGAQQRLVHTVITLKLTQQALQNGDQDAPALVNEALDNAQQATAELRELAHGILPAALTHGGLREGVDALVSRMPVPIDIDVSVGRLPAAVEATAYCVVAEALTNVAKHARAGRRGSSTARSPSTCATTASAAPYPTAAGSSGWQTGSPPSTGNSGSTVRPTAAPSSRPRSPSRSSSTVQ
jgi:signal transduction histidine kinase